MTEDEVKEIVAGAVDATEQKTENLPFERFKMASWLRRKFNIAIKELGVSFSDGMPYLKVAYLDDDGKEAETRVSMAKHVDKLTKELEKMGDKLRTAGE